MSHNKDGAEALIQYLLKRLRKGGKKAREAENDVAVLRSIEEWMDLPEFRMALTYTHPDHAPDGYQEPFEEIHKNLTKLRNAVKERKPIAQDESFV